MLYDTALLLPHSRYFQVVEASTEDNELQKELNTLKERFQQQAKRLSISEHKVMHVD